METGFIVLIVVACLALFALGAYLLRFGNVHKKTQTDETHGILNVDCGDPEYAPSLFLALKVPIEDVVSRKRVVFDVTVIQSDSQK